MKLPHIPGSIPLQEELHPEAMLKLPSTAQLPFNAWASPMRPPEGLSRQASAFAQEPMLALSQMMSAQILLGYMKTLTLAPCTIHLFLRE